jgi:hypothetical protein
MKVNLEVTKTSGDPHLWVAGIGRAKLGVHQEDGWCMQIDNKIVLLDSEDRCMPLLPVLEIDERQFFEFLQNAANSNAAFSKVIAKFPKELLLKHVFHTSFTGYWPEKALAWLLDDKDLQPVFRAELLHFSENSVMPQGARQKAQKILKALG